MKIKLIITEQTASPKTFFSGCSYPKCSDFDYKTLIKQNLFLNVFALLECCKFISYHSSIINCVCSKYLCIANLLNVIFTISVNTKLVIRFLYLIKHYQGSKIKNNH